jgi:pimeloyl-[acyl-carrier protein] methyl ester esterase
MSRLSIQTFGSGAPLALLHGWGFDSRIWQTILPDLLSLPQAYQIFLVDLPGFGESPMLPWSEFKKQLLAAIPGVFIIAGWSLGGLFATRLSFEVPQRIKKLLQIASTPYFVRTDDWIGIAPETLDFFYQDFVSAPQMTRQQFVQAQLPPGMIWDEHSSLDSTRQVGHLDLSDDCQSGLHEGLMILKNWDLRVHLAQLTMPVSYLFGCLDRIVPRKTLPALQQAYPHFHYTLLPHAGHMPFLSHRAAFIDWIKEQG